jgi:dual oxidase
MNIFFSEFKKPDKKLTGGLENDLFTRRLTNWLFTGCSNFHKFIDSGRCTKYRTASEYPGYDGWFNNLARPEMGAVDTPLLRRSPAVYEDGVYKPSGFNRPEPLEISEQLLSGKIGSKSKTGRNALLVFFGIQKQFIMYRIFI